MTSHRAHDAGGAGHLAYHQITAVGDEQISRHVHSNAVGIVERGTCCSTTITTRGATLKLGSHKEICITRRSISSRRRAVIACTTIASNGNDDSSSTTNFTNDVVLQIQDVQIVRGIHSDIMRVIHCCTHSRSKVSRVALTIRITCYDRQLIVGTC